MFEACLYMDDGGPLSLADTEQLKEAQGARERFFGNISHEIRTPLSLIMLATGGIQSKREHDV
jgi:signal transduction histidine kinase